MSVGLTKYQKQGLGLAISNAGFDPSEFVFAEEPADESDYEYVSLTHRDTSDRFAIRRAVNSDHSYYVSVSVPGTTRYQRYGGMPWDDVTRNLHSWAQDVKKESTAIDPWAQEAENMANDDSFFTIDELPKVDKAIQDSLDTLQQQAIEHGKTTEQIQSQLDEIKQLLQKTARTSTKREWMSIFKGIILEKLMDWGMSTALFQGVLHTLIVSAQDIAQLAEHASRHLP